MLRGFKLYVPVTVHHEQSVKREYQQDATIQMFIFNFRCFFINTVSTCFGHHYAHHQENKHSVLLHMGFALVVQDVAGCICGALRCSVRTLYAVICGPCSPDDGHNDVRNVFRQC